MFRAALPYRCTGMGLVLALVAAACGSSAETTTSPSAVRCGVSISEIQSTAYPPEGGAGSVRITTARECAWSAASDVSWVKLRGTSGQGEGVVEFTLDRNEAAAARSGGISINDQRRTLSQQGTPCGFELSSSQEIVGADGGERTVTVTTSARDCTWTAAASVQWLTIVRGRDGVGDGAVTFRVDRDDGPPRSAVLTVAGQQVQVVQSSVAPGPGPTPGCSYVIVPDDLTVPSAGASAAVQLSTGASCSWSAASNRPWIAIAPTSGTGPTRLQLTVSTNAGPARSGSASIAGRTLEVIQANGCTFSISPQSSTVSPGGGTGVVTVTTAPECAWSVANPPAWIQLNRTSGSGPGPVQYTASANASPARTGSLTIAGQVHSIAQESQCTFELAPPYHEFDANGGNGNVLVIVSGPCSWTASSSADWIKMTAGTTGTGNGLVQFVVPANSGGARQSHISIAGRNYLVTQAGR
jgi:hypothetical protein